MKEIVTDTRPEITAFQINLLRQTKPARKLALLGQMHQTVKTIALSGLRSRYPDDPPERLRRRLADLILGKDIARSVYGPFIE